MKESQRKQEAEPVLPRNRFFLLRHASLILRGLLVATIGIVLAETVDWSLVGKHLSWDLVWLVIELQVFYVLSNLLLGLRLVLLAGYSPHNWWAGFKAYSLSIGLNIVLPVRLSELVKPLYLKIRMGTPVNRGFAALIMERVIDLLVISSATLLALSSFTDVIGHGIWVGVIVASMGCMVIVVTLHRPVLALINKLPLTRVVSFLEPLILHIAQIFRSPRLLGTAALGLAGWTSSYLGVHFLISLGGSVDVTLTDTLFIFVLTLVGGAVAILPAGLGTYQAAAIFGLQFIGFGFEEALTLAVAMHILSLLFEIPFSACVLLYEDISLRDFRIERAPRTGIGEGGSHEL
ncbi:MAG: hypothetical protein COA62_11745 [Rhodobiaceae bacterium]|nr:MAG: hypothetical protein COA62_11745 [Rhodobiaceae bacterium]